MLIPLCPTGFHLDKAIHPTQTNHLNSNHSVQPAAFSRSSTFLQCAENSTMQMNGFFLRVGYPGIPFILT